MVREVKMGEKTYEELVVRLDDELAKAKFSHLELLGFKEDPMLAVRTGIAMGYKMAMSEARALFSEHYSR